MFVENSCKSFLFFKVLYKNGDENGVIRVTNHGHARVFFFYSTCQNMQRQQKIKNKNKNAR